MAEYHMLGDNMYGVGGIEDNPNMVNAGSYSHSAPINVGGTGMMSQSMAISPVQNPSGMMQGMVPMQQSQAPQPGSQMPLGNMSSYHQGSVHGFSQSEVPQKLHQYAGYGGQMTSGNAGNQYMPTGPRLHHIGDSLAPSASPQQQQPPRSMVPNQMAYQNRNMGGSHYGQQMVHTNTAPSQMPQQNAARYPNQYAPVQHHQFQQQHSMQQMNQSADIWQGTMTHPQMPRQCMPQVQNYPPPPTHQSIPAQHGNSSMAHSPLAIQGQRPSTPNQSQYISSQEYPVQPHAPAQAAQIQRSPVYNLNSSTINQNGTHIGQTGAPPQPGLPQSYGSLSQSEQGIYSQGHYSSPSQAAPTRPHYNPSSTSGSAVPQSPQQHLVGQQQMIGMRPSIHQMGYSPVSSRVNSGQQHGGALPPGSPARVQQYHPPFSPNQTYPTAAQPSPRSVTGDTATPPHMPHYTTQSASQSPTSPQYRNQFPPHQLTQSPQHMAATPPAEASAPTSSCTPDRSRHSTPVPQSQGSFPSPSTTHMASPSHGHSPGNSSAPPSSSLQHLEQMVMPHVGSGPTTSSNTAVASVGSSTTPMTLNAAVSGSYYSHIHAPSQDPQQQPQPHLPHLSSASDTHPPSQNPALPHASPAQPHSLHSFVAHTMGPQPQSQQTSSLGSVPNSQPVPPVSQTMATLPQSAPPPVEDSGLLEASQRNSVVGYNPINSSSTQNVMPTEPSLPQHTIAPAATHVSPIPESVPANHLAPTPASNPPQVAIPQLQHSVGPYQRSSTPVSYEMQQIQQEIQQLHSLNKNGENSEEMSSLQERLRYLQSQKLETPTPAGSAPLSASSNPPNIPVQFPRPPMMYGAGNQMPYIHQQPMPPQAVHYSPQGPAQPPPPANQERPMPILGPQPGHMMNDLYQSGNSCGPVDQEVMDPNSVSQNCYPPHPADISMGVLPPNVGSIDPYELNFNDEPPKKMKRRPPKEPKEPKPPKEKKPKEPKPKKPKKAKAEDVIYFPDDFVGPLPENAQRMEIEPGVTLPPLNEDGSITPLSPEKKKKNRKRKTKEKENDEPSSELKEPKPKKPKKKSPKKSKDGTPKSEGSDPVSAVEGIESDPVPMDESILDGETAEIDSDDKKDKKDSSVKSPKSSGSSSKSSKKSTPKKKLPILALRFPNKKKKKKKRSPGSPDNSDMEKTPPPSPDDGEGIQKRRSARNTNRKKYTDDIDLHLTDDETIEMEFGQQAILNPEGKLVQVVLDNHNEDYMVVEKILAVRVASKQTQSKQDSDGENNDSAAESCNTEEYYVKYKNLSYIHCEWKTLEELEKGDRRFLQKVKRFKQKKAEFNFFDFLEDEPFNPDYIEVDRVLDVNEISETKDDSSNESDAKENSFANDQNQNENSDLVCPKPAPLLEPQEVKDEANSSSPSDSVKPMDGSQAASGSCHPNVAEGSSSVENPVAQSGEESEVVKDDSLIKPKKEGKVVRHYLVKWRGLTYEESTWELEEDVDRNKIEHFERFRYPPPKEKWKVKKRPIPSKWNKLEESPIYKGGNTLREYQLEGVNWLTFCWYNGQNCILADEMGLGKTIQSIAFLNEIDKYGIPGPFLIIAPLSTIGNWQREFETWTEMNTITYHGSSPSRNMIIDYEMYWKDEKGERIQEVYKFQVLITTFEIILTDCMELKAVPWRCVIIDEAHRLKNRNCKLLEGLRLLNTEHRVLLTGTPLQNNVEELFSLLNFLEPNRFASTEAFLEEFGDLKTEAQVDKLKALLKPMMLRRLKEDVEKSLAPKEETVVEVELTNIQKKYYRAILERNFTFLTKGNCYSNIPNLMNTMMELRKCCIHPFLITGAEEQIIIDYKSTHEECNEVQLNAMIQASGKLVLIDKLLPRLRADGHRVLVFSQMVKCLDILEDYMVQRRYPYERIDGRVRGNLRQAAIDRFCKPDSDRFVFLLCTRAGGLGINLTAADTVIIFDSDWNPQNDLQAQARCHRIGQSKAVKVYRLICRNTYEREMFDKASLKLGLDKAVLQSMCPAKENLGMNQQMSKKEIEDLLRKGAYGALMEDDNAGDKFCEEDIDQILQRRTQVIQLESGTQGSTFSKATFASASTRSDIEIDDPNFWEKWAKKANLDVDELKNRNELIIQEPRRRTQTRRFGTDDQMLDLSELETSDDDDESVSTRTRASKRTSKISGKRPKNRGRALDRERDDEYMEEIAPGNWTRAECFKVEKGLLTFGWGRWDECIALGQFRRRVTHKDCEHISRTILLYCLLHYKGDEKIKSFIWDLICPTYEGEQPIYRNHSGLSAPVPRGRKGKKIKKEVKAVDTAIEESEWAKEEQYNPDILLNDEAYRKHLNRHANKVLLRVRLLYYLKHEIIGDLHDQVFTGIPASLIPLEVPPAEGDPPAPWWDRDVDKSLLLGIYKHGFERYNLMRQDPSLIFLSRCGPPDGAALLAELKFNEDDLAEQAVQEEAADKEGKFSYDKEIDDLEPMSPSSETQSSKGSQPPSYLSPEKYNTMLMMGIPIFPSITDVNTRVRRLITAYQRNNKKLEIRNAQKAKKMERREKFEAAIREREMKKRELQQRKWSRREEADFYRTISAFGVEYTDDKKGYNWSRFRNLARLERKYDDTLAEYYKSFYAMCKRVCGRKLTEEEEQLSFVVDPISEERASRCLQRVDLLHKIREEILVHPELDERLKLCQPSMDLPDWWQCGKHDKDLLIGAARHGLSRMDYHLLHDSTLSFKDVLKNHPQIKTPLIGSHVSTPVGCSSPVTTCISDGTQVKDEPMSDSGKEESKPIVKENFEPVASKEEKLDDEPSKLEEVDPPAIKKVVEEEEPEGKCTEASSVEPCVKAEVDTEPDATTKDTVDEKPIEKSQEVMDIGKIKEEPDDESKPVKVEENQAETDKDEETDIESDLKREDEGKDIPPKVTVLSENTPSDAPEAPTSKTPEPPVLEQQKYPQKYESNTDVDAKQTEDTDVEMKSEYIVDDKDAALCRAPVLDPYSKLGPVKMEGERKESVIKEAIKEEFHMQVEDSMNDEVMSQASFNLDMDVGEPTVAQLLAISSGNIVRWPKDKVLQIRLEHIVQAVEKNEWPIIRPAFLAGFPGVGVPTTSTSPAVSAPRTASPSPHRSSPAPSVTSREGHSRETTPLATPEPPALVRELVLPEVPVAPPLPPPEFSLHKQSPIPSSPMPMGDNVKHRRRRRRRRFEIEAERAKLRQLLSHNMQQQQQQQMQQVQQYLASTNPSLLRNKIWDDHAEDKVQIPGLPQSSGLVPPPPLSVPPSTSAGPTAPPPAHQNSSPRLSTTLGSLDLRVKSSATPPVSFPLLMQQSKPSVSPIENLSKNDAPLSPIDLSASSGPSGQSGSVKQAVKSKIKEGKGSRGGSRIDALALNLQARKQQQLMQEQHPGHPLDNISSASDHSDKMKEASDHEEPVPPRSHHHHHHHHSQQVPDKRSAEEEETKLRRKRLQYSEDAIRKSLNRAFEMTRAPPAHSSFLNSPISPGLPNAGRMHLGSKPDEQHTSASNSLLEHSGLMHHDFKKWLEEHPELVATNPNLVAAAAAAMAFNPVPSFPSHTELLELPEGRRRGRRPRLDPAKLDFDKVTGEENVSVINRLTGKKITGSKAPPLKHLAEWLDKNPMFDVDPKWGQLVREKGNLPSNMLSRIVTPSEKRGRRTAASLLASAHQNLVAPPSTMSFPSASSLNPLSFANTGMLTGFPNLNFFKDPPKVTSSMTPSSTTAATSSSNPPIFLPFGGLAGMGLTNPLFGFPGFNFPGLQGASSSLGGTNLPLSKDQGKDAERSKPEKVTDGSASSRKNIPISTSAGSANSIISSSAMPSATSLPFLYPAPGLLYNPLGLGSFTLPPNLPASFASFTQSGLVNGLGLNSPLITTSPMSTTATSLVSSAITSTIPSASHTAMATSLISPKGSHSSASKHSPSHSSLHETQDTDEESLKSLMGAHDEEEDDDMEDGKTAGYDNLEKEYSDRDTFREVGKSPIFAGDRGSAKVSESDSEVASAIKTSSFRAADLHSSKSKVISDDPTSDSTDTESKAS